MKYQSFLMKPLTVEEMNAQIPGTLMESLGIEYTDAGPDFICGRMPVDSRTKQPAGLLHGGASAALSESLGSMGSLARIDRGRQTIVGIEINANHLRKVSSGWVHAKASLVAQSALLHVWEIRISNDIGKLVCLSRLTVMIADLAIREGSGDSGKSINSRGEGMDAKT